MSSHSMTLLFSFYHIYARKQFALGCQDADGGGRTLSQSGTVFFPLINVAQICSNMSAAALEPTAQRSLTRIWQHWDFPPSIFLSHEVYAEIQASDPKQSPRKNSNYFLIIIISSRRWDIVKLTVLQNPRMNHNSTVPVEALPLVMFLGFLFLVWMLSFFMARGRGTLRFTKFAIINIVFYSAPSHMCCFPNSVL